MSKQPEPAAATGGSDPGEKKYVSLYQAHKKIYAKSVQGLFNNWRWAFVWLTQIVFYGLPWLMWNDRQAVLFELTTRRFYIFGLVFYPQDLIYLTALLLVSAYALFLFTAVSGRLWCGYACPQTVYTEIFMWVERKFEGDRVKRMKLDAAPWSAEKAWRVLGKHSVWILISLWTGFTFVGYFTPIRDLWAAAMTLGFGPWEWFWVLFYGFATWGNAGFMREQVCKYMCPYARFQSAMFDKDTLIITYDVERGEPRGTRSKKNDHKAQGLGDCVDCGLCVQVCPTGIDIRKGLQYECIGCAACIDACDTVMDKMGYARGLVRYDTQNGVAQKLTRQQLMRRVFRPRVLIYTVILILICVGVGTSIAMRSPFKADVVRDRASLARVVEDGWVENVYRLQVMNATESQQRYRIAADGLAGLQASGAPEITLGPAEAHWLTVSLRVPPETAASLKPGAHEVHFTIERLPSAEEGARVLREKSTFMLPR
ncbi:MAG: cytochrome c oxidase accessory protein CcoG [Burkholderiaceae bacterium]|nr:cytochrome c oxidase accessory protein CcoG [Burkholderiaceae bacterium]